MRNNYQNPITEDVDEFGKVGAETSYIQSQMHSHYDSENFEKMLASPLYGQDREDCESSRIPPAPGETAAMIQERSKCKAYSS